MTVEALTTIEKSAVQRAAERTDATAVDRNDVKAAAKEHTGGDQSAQQKAWQVGVAGLIGGAAIATGLAIHFAPNPPAHQAVWWVITVVAGVISFALVVRSYPRKPKNR